MLLGCPHEHAPMFQWHPPAPQGSELMAHLPVCSSPSFKTKLAVEVLLLANACYIIWMRLNDVQKVQRGGEY